MMDAANSRVRLMARERNRTDQYTDEEAQSRFEAALRGARTVGPKPMSKPHSTMKVAKLKSEAGTKAMPPRMGGRQPKVIPKP
jgi:hypothetical protein